jgi:hypothetical protein
LNDAYWTAFVVLFDKQAGIVFCADYYGLGSALCRVLLPLRFLSESPLNLSAVPARAAGWQRPVHCF